MDGNQKCVKAGETAEDVDDDDIIEKIVGDFYESRG